MRKKNDKKIMFLLYFIECKELKYSFNLIVIIIIFIFLHVIYITHNNNFNIKLIS